MAYNKAIEESKWKAWKREEEERMRMSDVPEEIIEKIRESDWESFRVERRYQEKVYPNVTYIEQQISEQQTEIMTIADLLNEIDNRSLYEVLSSVDKLTLEIIILKMQGYSIRESAKKLEITEKAAYRRFDRLKEKIKKVI